MDVANKVVGATESSIAKAREAQQKFQEAKAKVEETKAKAEEAIKKVKDLEQKMRALNALRKIPGGVKGGIAAIVASQVGTIRGKLTAQVQTRVFSMLSKFLNQCPKTKELERLIKTRNNLMKVTGSFQTRLNKLNTIATTLNSVIQATNLLIKIILAIPVPTAVIPPQVGGLGIPVKVLTKHSNTLIRLNKLLDKLSAEALAITAIISSTTLLLNSFQTRLKSIDVMIEQCSLDPTADINSIVLSAQPKENTGSEGIPSEDYQYKGFKLSILQDTTSSKVAPKRYAIAQDSRGVVVLKGPTSFSSSTQVLLDEIKFRIDNKLA